MVLPPNLALGTPVVGDAGSTPVAPLTAEDEFEVLIDGEKQFVTNEPYLPGGLVVMSVNGQNFALGTNFTFVANLLEWNDIPFPLKTGDAIVVSYNHS